MKERGYTHLRASVSSKNEQNACKSGGSHTRLNSEAYCLVHVYRDVFFLFLFFLAYHFSGKNVPPLLFVTEIHNFGCADITSLNEMLTCSWDKHTHVFSFQLAPSIRFYIL